MQQLQQLVLVLSLLFLFHYSYEEEILSYQSYYTGANLFSLNDGCSDLLNVKSGGDDTQCIKRVDSDLIKALAGCAEAMKALDKCQSQVVTAEGIKRRDSLRRAIAQTEVVLASCPTKEKDDLTNALKDCTNACKDVVGCDED